jgi:hypothetical protein
LHRIAGRLDWNKKKQKQKQRVKQFRNSFLSSQGGLLGQSKTIELINFKYKIVF